MSRISPVGNNTSNDTVKISIDKQQLINNNIKQHASNNNIDDVIKQHTSNNNDKQHTSNNNDKISINKQQLINNTVKTSIDKQQLMNNNIDDAIKQQLINNTVKTSIDKQQLINNNDKISIDKQQLINNNDKISIDKQHVLNNNIDDAIKQQLINNNIDDVIKQHVLNNNDKISIDKQHASNNNIKQHASNNNIKQHASNNSITSQSAKRTHSRTSKSKRVALHETTKFVNNTFIYIRCNREDIKPTSQISKYIKMFLIHINYVIAAKTSLNYHLIESKSLYIQIPIYVYTNEDAKQHPLDLILNRYNELKTFISTYDFNTDTKSTLWIIRTLTGLGINISTDFNITINCDNFDHPNIDEPIMFNYPDIIYPNIDMFELNDTSRIITYEDPYFNDYGVFVNLTVPFNEMGMSYNALHLYEHLMTKAWVDLSSTDQIYTNGVTYPTGICMVYAILANEQGFQDYANATFKWMFMIRQLGFWKSRQDDIRMETTRTISETRTERTLASMGRSDCHAYDIQYNTKIFEYWSNKPFTILLTYPPGTKMFDINKLNEICKQCPLHQIQRPKNISVKYYPFEVLFTKQCNNVYILKANPDDIKKAIMARKLKTTAYFGMDCYMGTDDINCDLTEYNLVLHPLLFLNRMFTVDDLRDFVRTHVTAQSSAVMSMQSMCAKHIADCLDQIDLNI